MQQKNLERGEEQEEDGAVGEKEVDGAEAAIEGSRVVVKACAIAAFCTAV